MVPKPTSSHRLFYRRGGNGVLVRESGLVHVNGEEPSVAVLFRPRLVLRPRMVAYDFGFRGVR